MLHTPALPARVRPGLGVPHRPRRTAAMRRVLPPPATRLRQPPPPRALTPDAAPAWTLDQIAGLVFGFGLLASIFLAYKVDAVVAKGQRAALGLCDRCGGVNEPGSCGERDCPSKGSPPRPTP